MTHREFCHELKMDEVILTKSRFILTHFAFPSTQNLQSIQS
jgi:hypothetical protein